MNRTLRKKIIQWTLCLLVPSSLLLIPTEWIGISDLTIIQHRVLVLFVLAAFFWVLEPIPIYATSILLITLELVMISDSSLLFFRGPEGSAYGKSLTYQEIMSTLASPVIVLFLGGFFLAAAATKYRLDKNIAGILLPKFGNRTHWVLLGLMCITATFSMFMSNTATTAMMLSILIPVLKAFPPNDKARVAFILGIPFAANLGGIGTPIGTPPNAIALKFLASSNITFGKWMAFGFPIVVIMLLAAWCLLILFFPSSTKRINLDLSVSFSKAPKAIVVYITFIVTILLWLFDFIHGMNSYVVAILPMCIFLSAGIINKEDLKTISWDVLWLVSGGIALGLALDKTGLAHVLIKSVPFHSLSPYTLFAVACLIGLFMANFMSNTATANLILPLVASIGTTVPGLAVVGGSPMIVLGTTICISFAMSLPISTPPNALAHATGEITTRDMAKVGILIGIIGLIVAGLVMAILVNTNFLA